MKCIGLITGVEHIKGNGKGDNPKAFDFYKVNFIDTESSAGSPQSMTLPKDGGELAKVLPQFEAGRMKIIHFNVFINGAYSNFGGFVIDAK